MSDLGLAWLSRYVSELLYIHSKVCYCGFARVYI